MAPVPSFKGLKPASEAASRAKQRNARRDTVHEVLLRRAVWRLGLRYRKNVESLPGKPDLVFVSAQVVVFCDGDFWHGRDWPKLRQQLQHRANPDYWVAKIESNMARDARTTAHWQEKGWQVVRLWETDIKRDTEGTARLVQHAVTKGASPKR